MTTADDEVPTYGVTFWVGLAIGWAVIGLGVTGMLHSEWLRDRPIEVATWVLGGLVAHDVALAPAVTAMVLVLARWLPEWLRGPITAALVLSGLVLLFAYPLLRGFGRRDANPSILPLDYRRNVMIILGAIWVVTVIVALVRHKTRRR